MIPLRSHGVLDYVWGGLFIVTPYIFGMTAVDPARNLFVILGLALIAYSLVTAYAASILKWIPIAAHLVLDCIGGILLVVGPSLFGYRALLTNGQFGVHLIFGFGLLLFVAITQPKSREYEEATYEEELEAKRREEQKAA